MTTSARILRYLAALAPTGGRERGGSLDVLASPADFEWLGDRPLVERRTEREPEPPPEWYDRTFKLFEGGKRVLINDFPTVIPWVPPPKMRGERLGRLARIDALDPLDGRLRAGAMWVVGQRRSDGAAEPIMFPAVSRRLRLHEAGGRHVYQPQWMSDPELHPILEDVATDEERSAAARADLGGAVVADMIRRAGLQRPSTAAAGSSPLDLVPDIERRIRHETEVAYVVAGSAVYLTEAERPTTVAAGLRRWSSASLDDTAFAAIYGVGDDGPDDADGEDAQVVESPLPTNAQQRAAIGRSRTGGVSVVSGPPGTGKTHLVAAAAVDAIANGESVLIATQSNHAAESVCELFDRHPTPAYLRFGRAEHRQRVAEQLAAGTTRAPTDFEMRDAERDEAASRARRDRVLEVIHTALGREEALAEGLRHRESLAMLCADAPGVLDESVDLVRAAEMVDRCRNGRGLFAAFRARRTERVLRRAVDARPGASLDGVARAVEVAAAEREVEQVLATGGVHLDAFWADLDDAEQAWRDDLATLVDVRRRHAGRFSRRRARGSVGALANVLRTGVTRRTGLLAEIESDDFLDLLPLWVGTLSEVEHTLPAIPALFDLLILDEASQIDQLQAAGVLCRAGRVMVVGDPRQLRHVSFLADDRMTTALEVCEIHDSTLRRLLDLRRNSIFDVAAAAAPVTWLDEHFRSVPHLIDFSAQHFYDGELRLMTQHPKIEGEDSIEMVRVDGERTDGVNVAEVETLKTLIADLAYRPGTGSIGVVTPFRAQADAITEMMLERFSLSQIRDFGLRAGTVHGFQGSERDTVIISLGLGADDLGRSLRFVEDHNLFNVMVTRARRRIVVLHSFDPADLPRGLLADYFRFADRPPTLTAEGGRVSAWTSEVAAALADSGERVIADYPVAGWSVDIALGEGDDAFGVECAVHPRGVDAHIERHLTLRRAGWELTDAFPSRFDLNAERAAVHLAVELQERLAASRQRTS